VRKLTELHHLFQLQMPLAPRRADGVGKETGKAGKIYKKEKISAPKKEQKEQQQFVAYDFLQACNDVVDAKLLSGSEAGSDVESEQDSESEPEAEKETMPTPPTKAARNSMRWLASDWRVWVLAVFALAVLYKTLDQQRSYSSVSLGRKKTNFKVGGAFRHLPKSAPCRQDLSTARVLLHELGKAKKAPPAELNQHVAAHDQEQKKSQKKDKSAQHAKENRPAAVKDTTKIKEHPSHHPAVKETTKVRAEKGKTNDQEALAPKKLEKSARREPEKGMKNADVPKSKRQETKPQGESCKAGEVNTFVETPAGEPFSGSRLEGEGRVFKQPPSEISNNGPASALVSKGGYYVKSGLSGTRDIGIYIPIARTVKSKDVHVKFTNTHLRVDIKGKVVVIDGELSHPINVDESFWEIGSEHGRRCVRVTLTKQTRADKFETLLLPKTPPN